MFARIEADQSSAARLADATKAALAVLIILVVAALVGARVCESSASPWMPFLLLGAVLSWIGFTMLCASSTPAQDPSNESEDEKRSITPLILFAASPGTITGVITVAVAHAKLQLPVTALAAVAVATAVMWIVMVLMAARGTHANGGVLRDTITQFMGLIIIAMGVQFALTGIRDFFLEHP
jgi:multiple antibiotic resistance protein